MTEPTPHDVFRLVPRDRRRRYVEAMRGTLAVQGRDFFRALHRLFVEMARALWIDRLALGLSRWLERHRA